MLELIVIAVYFLVMIAIGLYNRQRAKKMEDFFIAGRKSSAWFVIGSLLATIIGGSATVGMAGLGFSRGLTGAWWLLVGSIGLTVLGLFFAEKVRGFGLITLPSLIEKQYDRRVAIAASILIILAWIGIIAGQIIAAGRILSVIGIGSPLLWMTVFTIVFVAYTVLGGQQAILRTDSVQTVVIFIGIFASLLILLSHLGGFSGLTSALNPEQFAFPTSPNFNGLELISLLLLVGLTYVVGPDMYSRLFCAKDTKTAKKSALWTAVLLIPFALAITLIGMGASVLFPQIAAEQAFPTVINSILPPVVGSVVLAALLCAVMSSADTCLMSASTILTVDIVGKFKPFPEPKDTITFSQWAMVLLGTGSLALALTLQGVISALLFAYTIYTCGLILPVIAGFYKQRLGVTPAGAMAAIIGGGTAAIISKIFGIAYLDLGGLFISVILLFLVSFIDKKRG